MARIEQQLKPETKGYLTFWTEDKEAYYPGTRTGRGPTNLAQSLLDPERIYSQEELEALEQDGYELMLVCYVNMAQTGPMSINAELQT